MVYKSLPGDIRKCNKMELFVTGSKLLLKFLSKLIASTRKIIQLAVSDSQLCRYIYNCTAEGNIRPMTYKISGRINTTYFLLLSKRLVHGLGCSSANSHGRHL